MKRSPDGINGETFFQQRPPTGLPKVVRVENVDTDSGPQPRVIGGDLATLLGLAQLGVISMDPWHSRIGSLDEPDYAYLDLDPGEGVPFSKVVDVALAVRAELTALDLHGAARTSGSSGMHIAIPLPGGLSYDVAVLLAEFLATRVAEANPRIATVVRSVKRRPAGTVYVDYMQNVRGKSLASVYSVRARAGATVAAPLEWEEVTPALDIKSFTMDSVAERLQTLGDVWAAGTRRGNKLESILAIAGATA
jgi:bifunctional non-homologous end joining protein LigD